MLTNTDPARVDAMNLGAMLAHWARAAPDAAAIAAFGRRELSYYGLAGQVNRVAAAIRREGIGLEDRVAIALPQGPESLTACLAVAAGAVAVPINPAANVAAFGRIFDEVGPKALVTLEGVESTAREAAIARGIRVFAIRLCGDLPAGWFDWPGAEGVEPNPVRLGGSDDIALMLGTSGTTSRPKFVALRHRHVCHAAANTSAALALGPDDRCLDLAVLFHAHGLVAGAIATLWSGGCVVCPPEFSVDAFYEWIEECQPTWITGVPTVYQAILRDAGDHPDAIARARLRLLRSASAYLPDATRQELERVFRTLVIEGYGLTEAMQLTNTPLDPAHRKVGSLGVTGSSEVAIMAEDGRLVPPGERGEIVARGPVVVSSYWKRPDADAESFRDGWFRTGDIGYLDADGHLYLTGRLKDQINQGGEKVAPEDVDAALLSHPAVLQAVAFGMPHPTLGETVAAAVVLRPGANVGAEALRSHAAERLAEYQVPQQVFIVPALPASSIGKLLRRDLAQRLDLAAVRPPLVAPRNELERRVTDAWETMLGTAPVGINDNFFALGGDSLLAARMLARLSSELGKELPLGLVFQCPTIAELCQALPALGAQGQSEIRELPRDGPLPLSFAQQRLWVLDRMQPGSTAYNMPEAYRLRGPLDLAALRAAIAALVMRHESLRTTFGEVDGEPVQRIAPRLDLPVTLEDLSTLPSEEQERAVGAAMAREAATAFDLAAGPLQRVVLLHLSADHHVLLMTVHHIVSDGWSKAVLGRDLGALYAALATGQPWTLPVLHIQYADFAAWQRERLEDGRLEQQLDWWREYLAGAPDLLELPTDRPRPPEMSERGARFSLAVPDNLAGQLIKLARTEGVTLYQLMLAAFHVLLARYSRQDDIVTGSPVAGRDRPELESLVGFFVNTLLVRSQVDLRQPFRQFLAQVQADSLAALEHQEVPFERLVEALKPARSRAWSPLFQVMFILQNNAPAALALAGLEVEALEPDTVTARFDLTLSLEERGGRMRGFVGYRSDLFEHETIERMAGHFRALLAAVVADPSITVGALPLLTRREALLLADANPDVRPVERQCVHRMFEAHAAVAPTQIAAVCEDESISYGELNARANRLAHHLQAIGVGPDSPVALFLDRGIDMVVGLLGILKAGGAYLPLDPVLPEERLLHMLVDAEVGAVVTCTSLVSSVPESPAVQVRIDDAASFASASDTNPTSDVKPEHLAYLIYTSGSTGKPKGVGIEHRQLHNYVSGLAARLGLEPGASYATVSTLAADLGNTAVFPALMLGGCLHVITKERSMNGEAMADYFDRHAVDLLKITPSHLAALQAIPEPTRVMPRRWLVVGGEASSLEWVDQLLAMGAPCRVFNHYGPTETTVGVLTFAVTSARPATVSGTLVLGRPLPNCQVFVVDERLRRVPLGVPGELLIGGACVARGYLKRPELDAEKFIANPFGEGRLYRSGDLVRLRAEGNIEFLGRIDQQVKIRGFRVELGEIEAALRRNPGVRACAVVAHGDVPADRALAAYVVGEGVAPEGLRSELSSQLPDFMVPAGIVMLDKLPLTPNGKLDRRALPAPAAGIGPVGAGYAPARSELERRLLETWQRLLGRERVGIDDDFFDLGGHSLLAIRLFSSLGRELGELLPGTWRQGDKAASPLQPALLWGAPTVRKLAAVLETGPSGESRREAMMVHQEGADRPPFIMLTGDWGGQGFYVRALARRLDPEQPVWALAPHDLTKAGAPQSIEGMAEDFLAKILALQPDGPYLLGGYSHSGLVCFEIAKRLEAMGRQVELVFIIDTTMPHPRWRYLKAVLRWPGRLRGWDRSRLENEFVIWQFRVFHALSLWDQGLATTLRYYLRRIVRGVPPEEAWQDPQSPPEDNLGAASDTSGVDRMTTEYLRVIRQYVPRGRCAAEVVVVSTVEGPASNSGDPTLGWRNVARKLRVLQVPGDHVTSLTGHLDDIAVHLHEVLPRGSVQ
jgi:amino acid adenylation domain-containing protein